MNEETLRGLFRAPDGEDGARGACPDTDELWSLCRGQLESSRVERVLLHAAECERCREALEVGRLAAAGARAGEERRAARVRAWLLPAAAILLAGIGLTLVLTRFESTPGQPVRGEGVAVSWVDLGEGRPMPRGAFELRWQPVADGAGYVVDLLTTDLEVLERSSLLERPLYRVPLAVLEPIADGDGILWRVEARLANGDVARSPIFRTRIEP